MIVTYIYVILLWNKFINGWQNGRRKHVPFYLDLSIVFGKDRAQVNRAGDFSWNGRGSEYKRTNTIHVVRQVRYAMSTSNIEGGNANMQSEETSNAHGKKRKGRVDRTIEGFRGCLGVLISLLAFPGSQKNLPSQKTPYCFP